MILLVHLKMKKAKKKNSLDDENYYSYIFKHSEISSGFIIIISTRLKI